MKNFRRAIDEQIAANQGKNLFREDDGAWAFIEQYLPAGQYAVRRHAIREQEFDMAVVKRVGSA
ncbi:MAG: hypothetical protein KDC54_05115 [Lewinella sp.]|nr:hypothetical protein [Lewinella sp.]